MAFLALALTLPEKSDREVEAVPTLQDSIQRWSCFSPPKKNALGVYEFCSERKRPHRALRKLEQKGDPKFIQMACLFLSLGVLSSFSPFTLLAFLCLREREETF